MSSKETVHQIYLRGKEILMKTPNIIGVGFGSKEVAGKTTNELAFRVYVKEKKSKSDLSPEEIIPDTVLGYRTDVLLPGNPIRCCEDFNSYSDVIGGIGISNLIDFFRAVNLPGNGVNPVDFALGTLGCVATIDNSDSLDKYAFLTNNHVVVEHGGDNGDTIYNPKLSLFNGQRTIVYDNNRNETNAIGKILDKGIEGNHRYTYPGAGEQEDDYYIDCASVKINTCYSSWCETNCGQGFENRINGLNVNQGDNLTKITRLVANDKINQTPVYKVGRRTGRTVGKIVEIAHPMPQIEGVQVNGENVIVIEATENNCFGNLEFALRGDSGAVIVNGQREIVGLLFATDGTNTQYAYACHIHPVMDYLNITPITADNANQAQSGSKTSAAVIIKDEGGDTYLEKLKKELVSFSNGEKLFHIGEQYRDEVSALINSSRPVMVTWHRHKGPTFLAHCIRSGRDSTHQIPDKIDGISFTSLLQKMGTVLKEHGSKNLQHIIQKFETDIYHCSSQANRIEDFILQYKARAYE